MVDFTTFENMESEVRSYCRAFPTVFETARGSYLYDAGGRRYLDFSAAPAPSTTVRRLTLRAPWKPSPGERALQERQATAELEAQLPAARSAALKVVAGEGSEEEELAPTLKMKRKVIEQRYA